MRLLQQRHDQRFFADGLRDTNNHGPPAFRRQDSNRRVRCGDALKLTIVLVDALTNRIAHHNAARNQLRCGHLHRR